MKILNDWLDKYARPNSVELFDETNLEVVRIRKGSLVKLKRNPEFDNLMIQTVKAGLENKSWQGIVYIMHWLKDKNIIPLYIGKTEKKGVKNPISENIKNIEKNHWKFGRWGYALDYHIGDLSHAMFGGSAYRKSTKKHKRWADTLFQKTSPPILRKKVYVALISWQKGMKGPSRLTCSVASVEKELIALAGENFSNTLLNMDGK